MEQEFLEYLDILERAIQLLNGADVAAAAAIQQIEALLEAIPEDELRIPLSTYRDNVLEDLSDNEFLQQTRFNKADIPLLCDLFGLPDVVVCPKTRCY